MSVAPLLLACLLAPPPGEGDEAPLTGEELTRRAVAELDAALDAPLAKPVRFRAGTTLVHALTMLLPENVVLVPRLDAEAIDLRDEMLKCRVDLPAGWLSVREACERLLDHVGAAPLTVLNDGGVAKIATREHAGTILVVRIYPVRDLLAAAEGTAVREWEAELQNRWQAGFMDGYSAGRAAAKRAAEREAAENADGFADEESGFGEGAFSLPTVRNQYYLDRDGTLRNWRNVQVREPPPPTAAAAAGWALSRVIRTTTGGEGNGGRWREIDGDGGSVAPFGATLVARQTAAVHRQIVDLLAELRTAFPAPPAPVSPAPPENPSE
jgi:hypothetical protein